MSTNIPDVKYLSTWLNHDNINTAYPLSGWDPALSWELVCRFEELQFRNQNKKEDTDGTA